MNIYEVLKPGRPFAHPDMMGAFVLSPNGEYLAHCDNAQSCFHRVDFSNSETKWCHGLLGLTELCRDDWSFVLPKTLYRVVTTSSYTADLAATIAKRLSKENPSMQFSILRLERE